MEAVRDPERITALVRPPSGSPLGRGGAWQYDLRTIEATQLPLPVLSDDRPEPLDTVLPIRANVARVVTAVAGFWTAQGSAGCRPEVGNHPEACEHSKNQVLISHSALARLAFGHDGGEQLKALRAALVFAATYRVAFEAWTPTARRLRQAHLLSFDEVTPLSPAKHGRDETGGSLRIRFDPSVHEALMQGRYQRIPWEIVRGLHGTSYLIWQQLLSNPKASRLKRGDVARLPIRQIPLTRVGLATMRRDKRWGAWRRAADGGNELSAHTLWNLEIEADHAVLTRLQPPVNADAASRRTGRKTPVEPAPNKDVLPDASKTDSESFLTDDPRPDWTFLTKLWGRPPTWKQKGRLTRLGVPFDWLADRLREGHSKGLDPIEYVTSDERPRYAKPIQPPVDGPIFD